MDKHGAVPSETRASDADRFRDHTLGWQSSHPLWRRKKSRYAQLCAFVPVVTIAVLAALSIGSSSGVADALFSFAAQLPMWVFWVGTALVAGISAALTLSLVESWGQMQALHRVEQVRGIDQFFDLRVFVPFLVFGALLPFAAVFLVRGIPLLQEDLDVRIRYGFMLFALLPLIGLIIALQGLLQRPGEDEPAVPKRRKLIGAVAWILFMLALTTLALDLSRETFSQFRLTKPYVENIMRFVGLLTLLPLSMVVYSLYRLWPRWVPVEEKEMPSQAEDEVAGEEAPPEWLNQVLELLPCDATKEEVTQERLGTCNLAKSSSCFFGGRTPTVSQADVLRRFHEAFERAYARQELLLTSNQAEPVCADLVMEGEPGVGRSTAILACACAAVVERGQQVLIVTATKARQVRMMNQATACLRATPGGSFFSAGAATSQNRRAWFSNGGSIPDIIVATAAEWQQLFNTEPDERAAARNLLLKFSVVMIDDITDYDVHVRSHLAFMVDKQRLLLAGDNLFLQLVLASVPLSDVGRHVLCSRLFPTSLFDRRGKHVCFLKPELPGSFWQVEIVADDPIAMMSQLARSCMTCTNSSERLNVVLYQPGIHKEEAARLQDELLADTGRQEGLSVISDLDEAFALDPDEVSAILCKVTWHDRPASALRARMGNNDSVVFSLHHAHDPRSENSTLVIPVVADRSAEALQLAHLHNVAPLLPDRRPIPIRFWDSVDIPINDIPEAEWHIHLDAQFADFDSDEAVSELHAAVYPKSGGQSSSGLSFWDRPDEDLVLLRKFNQSQIMWGQREDISAQSLKAEKSLLRWEIGNTSRLQHLHMLHEFRILTEDGYYVPDDLRLTDVGVVAKARAYQGTGLEYYLPIWQLRWELLDDPGSSRSPEDLNARPIHSLGTTGFVFYDVRLRVQGKARVDVSIPQLQAESGFIANCEEIRFSFPSEFSCLVLQPNPDLPSAELSERAAALLAGKWQTLPENDFSPALTAAFNFASEAHAPGLRSFARTVAFRLTGERQELGEAVVWFLEPATSGKTAMRIVSEICKSPPDLVRYFDSLQWCLYRLEGYGDRSGALARRMAGVGFPCSDTLDDVSFARGVVESIRAVVATLARVSG